MRSQKIYLKFLSLLDFAAPKMKELLLNWHYRSKFEELILPSNRFIYNDKLVTFPNSAKQEKPIEFIYLEGGIWEKQTNDLEAKQTIELLQNLYNSGKKSVGVIAINAKQCKLIRDLIETRDELYAWLEAKDENGLFVKNLENCQGDERDTIIICASYAKDKDGKIGGRMFGQLNKQNSEKRLNVMFSRAREKVFLLSSLKSEQIPSQLQGKAIEFLKKYLTYAESGATNEGWKISANQNFKIDSDNFDSGFEEIVCKALRNVGFEVESQVGCSGYKIDLAIICPKTRNYILGIECDGEIYHSGKTARERDRLRQEVLENKGIIKKMGG
jgi:superfamily I DNA and/or RNA helicase